MGRPTKFNSKIVAECLELAKSGYSDRSISQFLNISEQTMLLWKNKHKFFRKLLEDTRAESAKECIEVGLRKLAAGSKDETLQEEFVEIRKRTVKCEISGEDLEQDYPVKVTKKTKIKAPDSKAIEILARKYDKEFAKEKQIEDKSVNINLLEGFTMRDLQESRKLNPIDAEYSVVADEVVESAESGSRSDDSVVSPPDLP